MQNIQKMGLPAPACCVTLTLMQFNHVQESKMSQQAAKRRRTQAKMNFTHIHSTKRPHYKKRILSVAESIARERRIAARIAASSKKK